MLVCFKTKSGKKETFVYAEVAEIRYTPDFVKDTIKVEVQIKDSGVVYETVLSYSEDLYTLKKMTGKWLSASEVCDFTVLGNHIGRSATDIVFKAVAS